MMTEKRKSVPPMYDFRAVAVLSDEGIQSGEHLNSSLLLEGFGIFTFSLRVVVCEFVQTPAISVTCSLKVRLVYVQVYV